MWVSGFASSSKTRDMEGGYSSAGYCEVANNDQLEGRSSKSAASEDPGTLESSTPFAKRCGDPLIGRSDFDPGDQT